LNVPPPANPAALNAYLGGTFDSNGHTEWVEGDVHETGFTTTFTPNTNVLAVVYGKNQDVDFTSMRDGESITLPTYAAITARGYHYGMINTLWMDGSVRPITNAVQLSVWRAMGTRAGSEVISD
jgi:prepilin-type processing-associated H-X9-DG protein